MLLNLMRRVGGATTPPYVFPYNPNIDYKWNTLFVGDLFGGDSFMVNSGGSGVDGVNHFGQAVKFNGIDQSIVVSINAQVQTVAFIVNGTQWYDEVTVQMTDYTINEPANEFIRGNYIFYAGIFTQPQKDYLRTYPNKFLYVDYGTLKSEILTQSEIDNVVAYFPMCEQDGYVRDMVTYSEAAENADVTSNYFSAVSSPNTSIETPYSVEYDLSVYTDLTNIPRVALVNSNYIPGELYVLEITLTVTSGFADITSFVGTNNPINFFNGRYYTGVHKLSCVSGFGFSNRLGVYFNGRMPPAKFKVELSTKKISGGIYPLTNYYNNSRGGAERLSHGLQTCNISRTQLGVPVTHSFDELQCDNIGYLSSMWVPAGEYSVELVYSNISECEETLSGVVEGFNNLFIGIKAGLLDIEAPLGGLSLPITPGNSYHVVIEVKNNSQIISVNGSQVNQVTGTPVDFTQPFAIGGSQTTNPGSVTTTRGSSGSISLFRTYDVTIDATVLYQDAQLKGLV